MNKKEKLFTKAKNAPGSLSFDELKTLLLQNGWALDRQKGSHQVWVSPKNRVVPVQPDGTKAKAYQVRQILRIMEVENE